MDPDGDGKGKMVTPKYNIVKGNYDKIVWEYEILESFFKNYDIVPVWKNCHFDFGTYNEDSNSWSGCVGKVKMVKIFH